MFFQIKLDLKIQRKEKKSIYLYILIIVNMVLIYVFSMGICGFGENVKQFWYIDSIREFF